MLDAGLSGDSAWYASTLLRLRKSTIETPKRSLKPLLRTAAVSCSVRDCALGSCARARSAKQLAATQTATNEAAKTFRCRTARAKLTTPMERDRQTPGRRAYRITGRDGYRGSVAAVLGLLASLTL